MMPVNSECSTMPATKSLLKSVPIIALVAVLIAVVVNTLLPPRWRPQLGVKNTGTNAVNFTFKVENFVSHPGQNWQMRFSAGDALTLRAAQPPDAPAPHRWEPDHVASYIRAVLHLENSKPRRRLAGQSAVTTF